MSAACLLHTFNVLFLLHRSQHLQAASHKACNCWQPPTATLPSSPLPLLFLPASKPGIKAHPTNWSPSDSQHRTCPQGETYGTPSAADCEKALQGARLPSHPAGSSTSSLQQRLGRSLCGYQGASHHIQTKHLGQLPLWEHPHLLWSQTNRSRCGVICIMPSAPSMAQRHFRCCWIPFEELSADESVLYCFTSAQDHLVGSVSFEVWG